MQKIPRASGAGDFFIVSAGGIRYTEPKTDVPAGPGGIRDRDHRQVKHMDQRSETKIIHTMGRNNCGGRCIIHAHVRDGQIEKLTTDTPQAAGDDVPLCACVRGLNYHKTFLGPDRLRYPMKRVGQRGEGKFQRISWEEATDLIAREWVRIRDTYGPGSRYVNYATGISAAISGSSLAKRLLKLDGGYLGYYNSYSTACIRKATDLMCGTCETGNSLSDWLNSNLIILWGHNPAETKFDSQTMYYLRRARKKGIPIIVVDPRRNDTAEQLGAEWIPLRPATDAALLDAMAYVIVEEGLQDQDFLDRCCLGFDKAHMPEGVDPSECVLSYLTGEKDGVPKTPEWAEAITGVPAAAIRSLAVRYATARPAALVQGFGAQRHGKRSGSFADFTTFSFHAVKNLTTAEGGAATWNPALGLDDEAIYKQYMLLSLHGQNKDALAKTKPGAWEYDIVAPLYKCNMTDIMAGIALAQLKRYPGLLESGISWCGFIISCSPIAAWSTPPTLGRTRFPAAICTWPGSQARPWPSVTRSSRKWPSGALPPTYTISPCPC